MSETSSQALPATCITPVVGGDRLKKGVVVPSQSSTELGREGGAGGIIVRVPRMQTTVAVKVNARLMGEQREIERANASSHRSGR